MTIRVIIEWVREHYDSIEPDDTLSVINGYVVRSWESGGRRHVQYMNTVEGTINEINYEKAKEAGL